ncbi:MAG TPA: hypothetical protein IAB62_01790 [Candidatus Coprocola pullicola]|nr:hypothetical protein [Candidatus Coprocola pullicola]
MKTLGKFAVYNGREYQFVDLNNGTYSLILNEQRDVHIGFESVRSGRYVKDVLLKDLDFVFEKNTIVKYKGDEFVGSIIEENKIMLYTRNVLLGKKYNMIMRDKDEYYLYVDLKDIDEINQSWIPLKQYNKK